MDFFYPNFYNDMWRVFGLIFFDDKNHFFDAANKRIDKSGIQEMLTRHKIGIGETATEVIRTKDNASDKFLEVVEPTDLSAMLRRLPHCCAVVTTGQKATDVFCGTMGVEEPRVGACSPFEFEGRAMRFYRMPSSSRAYPLALPLKAQAYASLFRQENIY